MQFFNSKVREALEHFTEDSYRLSISRGPLKKTDAQNNAVVEDLLCRSWGWFPSVSFKWGYDVHNEKNKKDFALQ